VQTHDGATLRVPTEQIGPHGSDAVRVGVRPEKVTLVPADSDAPEGANVLRGTVVVASFLGVSIQYLVRAAGGEELTVFAPNVDGAEPESLAVGREVQLTWNPHHTFVVAKEQLDAA
jgi:spermidine/putrescine transport system ATP-binding protein